MALTRLVDDDAVELVSFSFLREFGVLLTAILLAGRTASAFTAQIGAMVSREEVDAIRTLGLDPIDLLVTDVVMPRLDGPSLVREVRQTRPDLKVIFISGYAEDSFRKRLGEDTGIHFLPKPFSLKQLAGKVKEVLGD